MFPFALIVVVGVFSSVFLLFILQKIKHNYSSQKSARFEFLAIVGYIVVVGVILFAFPGFLLPVLPDASGSLRLPLWNSHVILDSLSETQPCGKYYCFDGTISSVFSGDFFVGNRVTVAMDCDRLVFGDVEVRGKQSSGNILANCSGVSDLFVADLPAGGAGS